MARPRHGRDRRAGVSAAGSRPEAHELSGKYVGARLRRLGFVDLFVRVSNSLAIGMYEAFGYRSIGGCSGITRARRTPSTCGKPLHRDKEKKSVVPLQHPVLPEDLEH